MSTVYEETSMDEEYPNNNINYPPNHNIQRRHKPTGHRPSGYQPPQVDDDVDNEDQDHVYIEAPDQPSSESSTSTENPDDNAYRRPSRVHRSWGRPAHIPAPYDSWWQTAPWWPPAPRPPTWHGPVNTLSDQAGARRDSTNPMCEADKVDDDDGDQEPVRGTDEEEREGGAGWEQRRERQRPWERGREREREREREQERERIRLELMQEVEEATRRKIDEERRAAEEAERQAVEEKNRLKREVMEEIEAENRAKAEAAEAEARRDQEVARLVQTKLQQSMDEITALTREKILQDFAWGKQYDVGRYGEQDRMRAENRAQMETQEAERSEAGIRAAGWRELDRQEIVGQSLSPSAGPPTGQPTSPPDSSALSEAAPRVRCRRRESSPAASEDAPSEAPSDQPIRVPTPPDASAAPKGTWHDAGNLGGKTSSISSRTSEYRASSEDEYSGSRSSTSSRSSMGGGRRRRRPGREEEERWQSWDYRERMVLRRVREEIVDPIAAALANGLAGALYGHVPSMRRSYRRRYDGHPSESMSEPYSGDYSDSVSGGGTVTPRRNTQHGQSAQLTKKTGRNLLQKQSPSLRDTSYERDIEVWQQGEPSSSREHPPAEWRGKTVTAPADDRRLVEEAAAEIPEVEGAAQHDVVGGSRESDEIGDTTEVETIADTEPKSESNLSPEADLETLVQAGNETPISVGESSKVLPYVLSTGSSAIHTAEVCVTDDTVTEDAMTEDTTIEDTSTTEDTMTEDTVVGEVAQRAQSTKRVGDEETAEDTTGDPRMKPTESRQGKRAVRQAHSKYGPRSRKSSRATTKTAERRQQGQEAADVGGRSATRDGRLSRYNSAFPGTMFGRDAPLQFPHNFGPTGLFRLGLPRSETMADSGQKPGPPRSRQRREHPAGGEPSAS